MSHSNTVSKKPVSSLVSMCIECVVRHVLVYRGSLRFLPPQIKERILRKLIKSNKFSHAEFDGILQALVHSNLKYIDLSSAPVTDDTLNHLTACSVLSEINLKSADTHNFTSEGLKNLFNHTERLLALDVFGCKQFDDEVMEFVSLRCPHLCELCCDGCNITNKGLGLLAQHNKNIKCLSISNTKITGSGIAEAVKNKNWRNIRELRLDKCTKVDDDVLKTIIQNCPKIEVLTFYNCAITDETSIFQDITNTCKKLKQLYWTINW